MFNDIENIVGIYCRNTEIANYILDNNIIGIKQLYSGILAYNYKNELKNILKYLENEFEKNKHKYKRK